MCPLKALKADEEQNTTAMLQQEDPEGLICSAECHCLQPSLVTSTI